MYYDCGCCCVMRVMIADVLCHDCGCVLSWLRMCCVCHDCGCVICFKTEGVAMCVMIIHYTCSYVSQQRVCYLLHF